MKNRDFYDIKADIVVLLKELKELDRLNQHEMIKFLSSFVTFTEQSTNAELANEIYKYQYNLHGSFKQNLYRLMYSADENNLSRLTYAFPKEVTAFKKYGRTGVETLKGIINEQ
jgi:hypothetical protein